MIAVGYMIQPRKQRRNNVVAAVGMLVGAALLLFASTQPWVSMTGTIFGHGLGGASLGFDELLTSDGSAIDAKGVLVGIAVFVGVNALALMATRIRGLGALWRIHGLLALAYAGILLGLTWGTVNDPSVFVAHATGHEKIGVLAKLGLAGAKAAGGFEVHPGIGLVMGTVGAALAAISCVIPAFRRTEYYAGPYGPPHGYSGWGPQPAD